MRKFKKTLTVMSLLSPLSVQALGVGEIQLHSALNQNLRAEIPLINSKGESVLDIRVSLASPTIFANSGVERAKYLSTLRFEPVLQSDGSIIIKVGSFDVIREPFLDFLVEVNWPQGKIVREFTVLLDPPVTYKKKTVSIPPAVQTQSGFQQPTLPPAPMIPKPDTAVAVIAPSVRPGAQSLAFGDEYGPVVRNDTLWKIVNAVRNDQAISKEQLLIAVFEHNPNAFYKRNINALKAGEIINIPSKEVVMGLSKNHALAEYNRQNEVWSGRIKDTPPETTDSRNLAESVTVPQNKLQLIAPSETEISESGGIGGGSSNNGGKSKADLALEMATTANEENQELKSRLLALEEQLLAMQRLVSLKDEQLALLQVQQMEQNPEATDVVSETGEALNQAKPGVNTELPSEQKTAKPLKQVVNPDVDTQLPPIQKPAKSVKQVTKPVSKQPKVTKPEDLLTEFLSEPYYLAAAGAGMALLGLLALVAVRKRRSQFVKSPESILMAPGIVEKENSSREEVNHLKEVDELAESSFLSEFTPSDFDALESEHDEVDPISEADVYLAYGRYQQAEDLIRQAIADNPERDECKLKLLEIFYAKENKSGFESYASELSKDKKDNPEFWGKVVEMGLELCPKNPLFAESQENKSMFDTDSSALGDDDIEVGDALFEEKSALEPNEEEQNLGDYTDQISPELPDMNVDSGATDENPVSALDLNDEPSQNTSLEFDLSLPEKDENEDIEINIPNNLSVDQLDDPENEALEFKSAEISSELEESIETPEANEENDGDSTILEFPDLNHDTDEEMDKPFPEFDDESDMHGESDVDAVPEMEFDLEDPVPHSDGGEDADLLSETVSSLTDMDETETKLDLAKAYVDMDESDAAKKILRGILENGNSDQQVEAQELLAKIEAI